MGKLGVVLAIVAIGSVAVMLLAWLWSWLGALGNAPVLVAPGIRPDEVGRRREARAPHELPSGSLAVVTLLRPERVSAS